MSFKNPIRLGALALVITSFGCVDTTNSTKPNPNPTSSPTHPKLVDIAPATILNARDLQRELPGAKVHFSAQHGGITKVESVGLDLATDTEDGVKGAQPEPLVESRGTSATALDSSTMEFFIRFGKIYGLTNPQEELQLLADPMNDPALGDRSQNTAREISHIAATKHRTYAQTYKGIRIVGRYAHSTFDTHGGLMSVHTRLLPISADFDVTPKFTGAEVWNQALGKFAEIAASELKRQKEEKNNSPGKTHDKLSNDSLAWLANIQGSNEMLQHAEELVIAPIDSKAQADSLPIDSLSADATPRLAYRIHVRRMGTSAMIYLDAKTGEVIAAVNTMPADWWDTGSSQVVSATDELGTNRIIMTTLDGGFKYMSISPTTGSGTPVWLEENNGVSFSNSAGRTDASLTYYDPIQIKATKADGSQNLWSTDPTFNPATNANRIRQVSAFNRNMIDIWDFWMSQHDWRSWDGQGSTLWASINNHKSATAAINTELNAWGGNGVMQIGDGMTSTGQYCGASHEIVGHEMGHNVLGATAPLDYLNQSGAINEAIADFWGLAITANRGADDWVNTIIGDDIGWNLRDMMTPSTYGQPDKFSNFVVTAGDSGGVHTNSGIVNKAHALLVRGGTHNGITVTKVGLDKLERVLFSAQLLKIWPKTASMEEWAGLMVDMCKIADLVNTLFGDTSWHTVCPQFRKAYRAVEMLPTTLADIIADFHIIKTGKLVATLGNAHLKDIDDLAAKISGTVSTGGGKKFGLKLADFVNENGNSWANGKGSPDLHAGEIGKAKFVLPPELLKGNYDRLLTEVELTVPQMKPSDWLKFKMTLGSDYVPLQANYNLFPAASGVYTLTSTVQDWGSQGFPAGLTTVMLTRHTGSAPLQVYSQSESSLSAATDADEVTVPENDVFTQTVYSEIIIPSATEVPGHPGRYQVWLGANGALPGVTEQTQLYAFADAKDQVNELNEMNNLVCLNCRAPGQMKGDERGVIVRLPKSVPVSQLFPAEYVAAASKLRSPWEISYNVKTLNETVLPYRVPNPGEQGFVKLKRRGK